MKKFALIVAGGMGSRMKSETPKQFMLLAGKPILMHTIAAFAAYNKHINILLVLPPNQVDNWNKLCKEYSFNIAHQVTNGGPTRFDSVKKGLSLIDEEGIIAVHDGARPLVSRETIKNCFETAEEKGNAVPAIILNDSIRQFKGNENMAVNRKDYCLIQTPQCFKSKILHDAYQQGYIESFTDDASVVEMLGERINIVEGNKENIKITTPGDLIIAEALMKNIPKADL